MNRIVCRLNKDDKFSTDDIQLTVDLSTKEQYHYTFFDRNKSSLYQFPKMYSNVALDLLYFSFVIFFADRKIRRASTDDGWTRHIKVFFPVLELKKWQNNKLQIEELVSFLSGDNWEFEFRERKYNEQELLAQKGFIRRKTKVRKENFCMLSGGLDSFIGAIDLLSESKNINFIGLYGGGKGVKPFQDVINEKLINHFKLNSKQFFNFHAAPLDGIEDTTRTRSLLFFAHAIILASSIEEPTTIFVPENGLISLNIPQTNSRLGSNSTRTTHPFYMGLLQSTLNDFGLNITLNNPYQFFTKGEMIINCKDQEFLKTNIGFTMSCSHPDLGRYQQEKKPSHCGNCLPCVIRRAAILKAYSIDPFTYRDKEFSRSKTSLNNLKGYKIGVLDFLNRNMDNSLIIQNSGPIKSNLNDYYGVYKRGMIEVQQLLNEYE